MLAALDVLEILGVAKIFCAIPPTGTLDVLGGAKLFGTISSNGTLDVPDGAKIFVPIAPTGTLDENSIESETIAALAAAFSGTINGCFAADPIAATVGAPDGNEDTLGTALTLGA